MPGFHRYSGYKGYRGNFGHRGAGPLRGAIWMIGIGVLMLWGHWWPGILVLIGISMVLGAFWKSPEPDQLEDAQRPIMPPATPEPVRQPIEFNRVPVAPAPVNSGPRIELLPATCPRCGAPVRSPDVKWRGDRFAACAYCGSNVIVPHNTKP